MWNKELSSYLNNNYDFDPDLLWGFAQLLSQEHEKENSCCLVHVCVAASKQTGVLVTLSSGHSSTASGPDWWEGTHIHSVRDWIPTCHARDAGCVFIQPEGFILPRSVLPTHKLMVLCHFVPIRAKLPAKLYLNMGLVDRTSHTGQKRTVPPLDSCRVRPRVDSHDVRCWDPWCQEVLLLYAACLLPTGGLS